jgi:hypothetical protein
VKSTIRRTPNARRRTRRRLLASALAPLLLCFASGCAVEQQQVSESLDRPGRIDCRTADGDLRVLQGEKAHVAQRLVEGATAIYPAGAVMGVVMGTEGTKLQVATGEYNDKIDARIAEIKSKCGIY